MKFIIVHGSFGNPEEHWFPYLATQLRTLGHTIMVPQLPCDSWDDVVSAGPAAPAK
jgi:predicted alpha/beta hydrolase family esterase